MFLHRLHVNLRCREARRDLSDLYQMHATLCRAFSPPNQKCPEGELLWRLEPETDSLGNPIMLVQSRSGPDWTRIGIRDWFVQEPDPKVDLTTRLKLESRIVGQRFRYRLRANPCVTRNGKRLGLLRTEEQVSWMRRKGELHGFSPETIHVSQEGMSYGKQHEGNTISIFSALFDGILVMTNREMFGKAITSGIGHGKAMGLGLLSVIPIKD